MSKDDGGAMVTAVGGETIFVSPHRIAFVASQRWRVGTNGYVYLCGGRTKGRQCLLHRIISRAFESGLQVHHRNGNKLDNRDENLALVSASEHQTKFHAEQNAKHNAAQQRYQSARNCAGCGISFVVPAAHRGRNRFCTKACGNKNRRKELADG